MHDSLATCARRINTFTVITCRLSCSIYLLLFISVLYTESYNVCTFVVLKEIVKGRGMVHSLSAGMSLDMQLPLVCDVMFIGYS